MAIYFQLTNKETNAIVGPGKADDLMREHFGAEPNSKRYYENWYDTIGFSLAAGNTQEEVKEFWPEKNVILDYILDTYSIENGFCR